jgi:copper chaperone CopZ
MSSKNSKGAVFTGLVAALAASSCCIPPIIAAIAGIGGASSSMSWVEPFRPYLIGLAVVAIGYAWYSHLKQKKEDDCGCSIGKPKWYQTRTFLVSMTVFAVLSISLPYYSGIFYSDNKKEVIVSDQSNVETIEIKIDGMTCNACQEHVDHAVNELNGIISINTSYSKANTIVEFDSEQTSQEKIEKAVNSTGYTVKQTINITQ